MFEGPTKLVLNALNFYKNRIELLNFDPLNSVYDPIYSECSPYSRLVAFRFQRLCGVSSSNRADQVWVQNIRPVFCRLAENLRI